MVKELGVWGVGALGTRGLAVKLKQGSVLCDSHSLNLRVECAVE